MSFKAEMEQFDDEWAGIVPRTGGAVLDAGDYQAFIQVSRVEKSDWDVWQFRLTFEDLGGKGVVTTWCNLEEEIGRSIAKGYTSILGWDGDLSDLEEVCGTGRFDDLIVDIRVKDNVKDDRTYKVVYINRLHKDADGDPLKYEAGAGHEQAPPPTDDDLPF